MSLGGITDDCYGTIMVEWQGADLQPQSIRANPESSRAVGAFVQDPAGWIQRYTRPNPASTAGFFVMVLFSGGFEGSVWPYVPTVKLKIYLPNESTQASAHILASAFVIAITDRKAFLLSLRKALGIKGKIDPALLTFGPVELKEEEEK